MISEYDVEMNAVNCPEKMRFVSSVTDSGLMKRRLIVSICPIRILRSGAVISLRRSV